jgi:Rab-GTPase-TBC domain
LGSHCQRIVIMQVCYVQGMNEIVGTIYYVLANDINGEWATQAEADSYFLFNILMIEMRDVFVPDMDDAETGIQGRITNMKNLLSTHDPALQEHLQDCGIDSSFYAIRWLTTLLSREFLLPDTIRMWDSMFASTHKENFLRYVCGTMVLMIREELLKGDFSSCLRLLQRYPPVNVDKLLESSRALWIYESQITMACHKGGISLHQALSTISPPPAIIMAFGLRGGVGPRRSSIHRMRVNEAAQEAIGAAQDGLLGRAMKLWSGWGSATATAAPTTGVTTAAATSAPGPVEVGTTISSDQAVTANTEAKPPASDQPPCPPPPQPRVWNRVRNNTADTNDSTDSINEATNSKTGVDSNFRSRIWGKAFSANGNTPSTRNDATPVASAKAEQSLASNDAVLATGNSSATLPTPPRSRLWNRGARSTTPVDVHNGVAAPTSNVDQASTWTSPWTAPTAIGWKQDAMSAAPHAFAATRGTPNVSVDPMLPKSVKRNHMSDVVEILST